MSVSSSYSDGEPAISFCLTSLRGELIVASGADVPFYAASTAKLAVLIAAVRMVEAGGLSLDQPVQVRRTFSSVVDGAGDFGMDGDEVDTGLPADGETAPLGEVLRRMITVSSNEATNLVLELVGLPAVNAAFAECGAASSRMERPYGDLAALDAGLTQQVTAADLAAVMSAIVSGETASPSGTAFMTDLLRDQEFGVIGPAVPAARWGSKSGWVTGIVHDVAFVEPVSGDGYVLAVCTRGYTRADGEAVIRSLATMAWAWRTGAPG